MCPTSTRPSFAKGLFLLERCAICAEVSFALTSGGSSYPHFSKRICAASLSTLVCVYNMVSPIFAIAHSAASTSCRPIPRPRCVGLTHTSDKYALSLGALGCSLSAPYLLPFGNDTSEIPTNTFPTLADIKIRSSAVFTPSKSPMRTRFACSPRNRFFAKISCGLTLKNKSITKFVASSTSSSSSTPITTFPFVFISTDTRFTA
mmetsp:Transcript_7940/g.31851  ORF Transcript_7940/g.31851 Transcript_7940/m.31851 type:complete len:204 (-) Transcript_7940:347-958(-)